MCFSYKEKHRHGIPRFYVFHGGVCLFLTPNGRYGKPVPVGKTVLAGKTYAYRKDKNIKNPLWLIQNVSYEPLKLYPVENS